MAEHSKGEGAGGQLKGGTGKGLTLHAGGF